MNRSEYCSWAASAGETRVLRAEALEPHAPGIAAWRYPVESVTISRVWRGFSAR